MRSLVERYEELLEFVDTSSDSQIFLLVRLLDLRKAIRRLGPKEFQAVLLCGLHGISVRTAGVLIGGVSKDKMHRRYTRALESLTTDLNGGTST